jgi:NTP pyrophosphatase (non-canonical NTP hydrolase)
MHLAELQREHRQWIDDNFPNQLPHQPLLGLAEEVGELAHAHLKGEQGIRGMNDKEACLNAKIDAIGDIVIFLTSYCNANSIDLERAVAIVWNRVSRRDWVANPQRGVE